VTTENWIALATGLLTPAALAYVAYLLNRRFKHFERSLEEQRRITEARFELYKDIGFKLNDLYSYFSYVGNWKEHSPKQIIEHKRELDRHVFTYRPIFSEDFNHKYDQFVRSCFKTYGGWGKDARLRTSAKHRAEEGDKDWAVCFTGENNHKQIKEAYGRLLECLAVDLGVKQMSRK
jgi:hypothetical protein